MTKTRRAGFRKKRRRGGRKTKRRRGCRRKSRRGGNNSLLKNTLLQLVNSSSFDNFAKFAKENGKTINKNDIIAKIESANDTRLNESFKTVLGKMCMKNKDDNTKKILGGAPGEYRHEFRIDAPMFDPASLFNCILWAVVLIHMNMTILLGIWIGMCTGAGGIPL